MSIVAFDTLKFVEKLETAGISRAHAKATAEAVADSFVAAELADKADIAAVRGEATANKTELKSDIAAVKAELKSDIAILEQRMTAGFRDVEQRMTIKLGGMLVVITGILLAAIRYLPPH